MDMGEIIIMHMFDIAISITVLLRYSGSRDPRLDGFVNVVDSSSDTEGLGSASAKLKGAALR